MRIGALDVALHQQFAVDHAVAAERRGDVGKAAGDVVAGAAVEPGLARDADDLDADPVPFPLGGIIVHRHARLVERVGEHERAEHRHVARGRLLALALGPGEDAAA